MLEFLQRLLKVMFLCVRVYPVRLGNDNLKETLGDLLIRYIIVSLCFLYDFLIDLCFQYGFLNIKFDDWEDHLLASNWEIYRFLSMSYCCAPVCVCCHFSSNHLWLEIF